jgi:hypothetical protein
MVVFTFGSNLAGRHGKGAAKYALQHHHAKYGIGNGIQGESYAIPTKDENIRTLPLNIIKQYVDEFLIYAQSHVDDVFHVTRIGCGLAGYSDYQIAPLFNNAPNNCEFDNAWKSYLPYHDSWC